MWSQSAAHLPHATAWGIDVRPVLTLQIGHDNSLIGSLQRTMGSAHKCRSNPQITFVVAANNHFFDRKHQPLPQKFSGLNDEL